jgi:hypothetical protein
VIYCQVPPPWGPVQRTRPQGWGNEAIYHNLDPYLFYYMTTQHIDRIFTENIPKSGKNSTKQAGFADSRPDIPPPRFEPSLLGNELRAVLRAILAVLRAIPAVLRAIPLPSNGLFTKEARRAECRPRM